MSEKDHEIKLLWADDDLIYRRFRYTKRIVKDRGWELISALDVVEAIEKLHEQIFDFILLDQMMPFSRQQQQVDYWGASRVLHWLLGKPQPPNAPPVNKDRLDALKPRPGNKRVPRMILSAFDDIAVRKSIESLDPEILMETKPFDPDQLIETIELILNGESDASI